MDAAPLNLPKDPALKRDIIALLDTAILALDKAGYYNASALVSSAIDEVEAANKTWNAPNRAGTPNHGGNLLCTPDEDSSQ